jgi:hypothetical protein
MNLPVAWLVTAADGTRTLFLDQTRALQYAALAHGEVHGLYLHPEAPQ